MNPYQYQSGSDRIEGVRKVRKVFVREFSCDCIGDSDVDDIVMLMT